MDAKRFDTVARIVGEQTDRRKMLRVATAGTLSVLGLSAFGRVALGQEVTAESRGYKGDSCDPFKKNNADCRQGLFCDSNSNTCQYPRNCGGKKGDACQGNGQCCKKKNLICNDNNRCVRNK